MAGRVSAAFVLLALTLPASAGATASCEADGTCDQVDAVSLLQSKFHMKAAPLVPSFLQVAKFKGFKSLKKGSKKRGHGDGDGSGDGDGYGSGGGGDGDGHGDDDDDQNHPCASKCVTAKKDCPKLCGDKCEDEGADACKECVEDNGCHECAQCIMEHHPCHETCKDAKNTNGEHCYMCKDACEDGPDSTGCQQCLGDGCQACAQCHYEHHEGDDDDDDDSGEGKGSGKGDGKGSGGGDDDDDDGSGREGKGFGREGKGFGREGKGFGREGKGSGGGDDDDDSGEGKGSGKGDGQGSGGGDGVPAFLQNLKRSKTRLAALKRGDDDDNQGGGKGKGKGEGPGGHPCMGVCTNGTAGDCFSHCGDKCDDHADNMTACEQCIERTGCHECAMCIVAHEPCGQVCLESNNTHGEPCFACEDECKDGNSTECRQCLGQGCRDCVECHLAMHEGEGDDDDDDHHHHDDGDDDDDDHDDIPPCAASCEDQVPEYPTCDDIMKMVGEGGCAASCDDDIKKMAADHCQAGDDLEGDFENRTGKGRAGKGQAGGSGLLQAFKRRSK